MNTLSIPDDQRPRPGALARVERRTWLSFCVVFGMLVPIAFLVLDPGFLDSHQRLRAVTATEWLVYSLVGIEIGALCSWLVRRRPNRTLSIVLWIGATLMSLLTCFVFPMTVIWGVFLAHRLGSDGFGYGWDDRMGAAMFISLVVIGLSTPLTALVYLHAAWNSAPRSRRQQGGSAGQLC